MAEPVDLREFPVHLGLGARVERLERFDGSMEWYGRLVESTADDGFEGRLVAMHDFAESWDSWEMHPNGSELVVCIAGTIRLVQEIDGAEETTTLDAGQYAINQPGVWHTADVVEGPATALFITAGVGTEHRPR